MSSPFSTAAETASAYQALALKSEKSEAFKPESTEAADATVAKPRQSTTARKMAMIRFHFILCYLLHR